MSKLIPMACLALPGTAGHAWALPQSSDQAAADPNSPSTTTREAPTLQQGVAQVRVSEGQQDIQPRLSANNLDARVYETARSLDTGPLVQSAATLAHTYTTLGVRHEMKL